MIDFIRPRHVSCLDISTFSAVERIFSMSVTAIDAKAPDEHAPSPDGNVDFSFLPKTLVDKCKPFIIRYHELNGFSSLPDILWHPETRNFIETNPALQRLFKKSTSSRSAKKANEGFVLIATVILSTEILASGFAGWATRYPAARRKAQALLAEYIPSSRAWLIERYLYPQIDRSRAILGALAPDATKGDQLKKLPPELREDDQEPSVAQARQAAGKN
jgi:hypothetical protein